MNSVQNHVLSAQVATAHLWGEASQGALFRVVPGTIFGLGEMSGYCFAENIVDVANFLFFNLVG